MSFSQEANNRSTLLHTDTTPDDQWFQTHLSELSQAVEPSYFKSKRWFGSKSRTMTGYRPLDVALLTDSLPLLALVILEIQYTEGEPELYHLPLALGRAELAPASIRDEPGAIAARLQADQNEFWLYDAFADESFCRMLYQGIYDNRQLTSQHGTFRFEPVQGRIESREVTSVKRISTEQSNTSVIYNNQLILKAFRKLSAGQNPDFEVPFFLTTHTNFKFVPGVAGYVEYHSNDGQVYSVGALQDFIKNDGDGYTFTLDQLRSYFGQIAGAAPDTASVARFAGDYPTAGRSARPDYRPAAQRPGFQR